MSDWTALTETDRLAICTTFYDGGFTIAELADKFSMRQETLGRYLRRIKNTHAVGTGVSQEKLPLVVSESDYIGKSATKNENQNTLVAEYSGHKVRTLDDLVTACNIDISEWSACSPKYNTWQGFYKTAEGDHNVVQMYQVSARFVRKNPVQIMPAISCVNISSSRVNVPKQKKSGKMHRCLLIGDPHFGFYRDFRSGKLSPFHDRSALSVAMQIANSEQFDKIVLLGDILDLPDWSDKFLRSPEFSYTTMPALIECSWWINQLGLTDIIEGNHCVRMERSITKYLPYAYGLQAVDELSLPPAMSIPKLLALHKSGVEWHGGYPDSDMWLNNRVHLTHGSVARGTNKTASAVVQSRPFVEIFGHIHRIEWASHTIYSALGQEFSTAFSPGTVAMIDGTLPGRTKRQQWQQGVAVVDYDDDTAWGITPVPIINGTAVYNGDTFTAIDVDDAIKKDTKNTGWRII